MFMDEFVVFKYVEYVDCGFKPLSKLIVLRTRFLIFCEMILIQYLLGRYK